MAEEAAAAAKAADAAATAAKAAEAAAIAPRYSAARPATCGAASRLAPRCRRRRRRQSTGRRCWCAAKKREGQGPAMELSLERIDMT